MTNPCFCHLQIPVSASALYPSQRPRYPLPLVGFLALSGSNQWIRYLSVRATTQGGGGEEGFGERRQKRTGRGPAPGFRALSGTSIESMEAFQRATLETLEGRGGRTGKGIDTGTAGNRVRRVPCVPGRPGSVRARQRQGQGPGPNDGDCELAGPSTR
ncbi:uncharacterized protein LY79DRAFT_108797 [Colletotrichum navitas]|uniref:Uncharacterized protein n=1 Tax=Colletotrichum navitas TaxID=681940 RepID=A0AAD8Q5U3_9PEZI|nr:uncharacterized protein LY79DRAFT_108797 [Colletotrichum navitas]KAK1595289.1 hypothetical protein LY79DRAFT_108797 [Colletotrichum navitas]